MIFNKNTNGTYTIDLDSTIKSTYNSSTVVKIDTISVGTSLPYTGTISTGVHEILLELSGSSGTYKEKKCVVVDDALECQVLTRLASMTQEERALDNSIYQYFLIKESGVSDGCVCACTSIKTIYDDLKSSFLIDCCS